MSDKKTIIYAVALTFALGLSLKLIGVKHDAVVAIILLMTAVSTIWSLLNLKQQVESGNYIYKSIFKKPVFEFIFQCLFIPFIMFKGFGVAGLLIFVMASIEFASESIKYKRAM